MKWKTMTRDERLRWIKDLDCKYTVSEMSEMIGCIDATLRSFHKHYGLRFRMTNGEINHPVTKFADEPKESVNVRLQELLINPHRLGVSNVN